MGAEVVQLGLVQHQEPQAPIPGSAARLRRQADAYAERAVAFVQALRCCKPGTPEFIAISELQRSAMEGHDLFHAAALEAEGDGDV